MNHIEKKIDELIDQWTKLTDDEILIELLRYATETLELKKELANQGMYLDSLEKELGNYYIAESDIEPDLERDLLAALDEPEPK